MRIPSIGKLAVLATALSFLVSGVALAQGATSATPATPASPATPAPPATPAKPAAPAAANDNTAKTTKTTKAKAKHKRSHDAAHKAKSHRKEKAAG